MCTKLKTEKPLKDMGLTCQVGSAAVEDLGWGFEEVGVLRHVVSIAAASAMVLASEKLWQSRSP